MAKACKVGMVKSMRDFQKRYFPKSHSEMTIDTAKDSEQIAIEMANRSIKSVNRRLKA